MECGAQCVMMPGDHRMLKWSADSLVLPLQVLEPHALLKCLFEQLVGMSLTLGAVALFTGFPNGATNVPIWLDQVNCLGTETRLVSCPANPIGQHDCSHIEDAGVRCNLGMYYTTVCLVCVKKLVLV